MYPPGGRTKRLAAVVLAVGLALVQPTPANAGAKPTLAERIAAAGVNWRTALAADLAALPHASTTVAGPLRGQMLAATLRLPATIELAADTTIIANELVFTGSRLRVVGNGFALSLYPVSKVRAERAIASEITIDTSPPDGPNGRGGSPGIPGFSGFTGQRGDDGTDPFDCMGTQGGRGEDGENGLAGDGGEAGGRANSASDITLDIPNGSTDSYRLIARGGRGGNGGDGGEGGAGGSGGGGGQGGNSYFYCYAGWAPPGGPGGDGGNGATGGTGGRGGSGGSGGNAGSIRVTYPSGYNPSWIQYDVSGGMGGQGGRGGWAGQPGWGGYGGPGGYGEPYGPSGQPGWGGLRGGYGQDGDSGSQGGSGSYTATQR